MGWSGFIPLVRLSFVCYLTHLHMVYTYLHSMMQPLPYTPYAVVSIHIFITKQAIALCL